MEQELFFRAIEEQNIQLVRELLEKHVKVNALNICGTALYRSVKLHNFEICKLLVENDADCNIVQLDFDRNDQHDGDGSSHSCFISTPIDFLGVGHEVMNDAMLQYLLENRPMVNENMVEERILYCLQFFDDENHETLFDYAASYFLRKNMYFHLLLVGKNALLTMITAILNINATLPNETNEPLTDGGTHEAFFTLIIRSLFEELVRFKLRKSCHIVSEQQYMHILRELLHNLEAYNLITDISCIPDQRKELFYPSIMKNIINKLKQMKDKDEYTLPIRWDEHAVCLNFVREYSSIAIRIDNLNIGEMNKHKLYKNKDNFWIIIPRIIGEIPLDKLDDNQDYFISLLKCIKEKISRPKGIETLYDNSKLEHLDKDRASIMTKQLEEQSKTLNCFIQQAESNCFIKSNEPGLAIRSNDYNIYRKIITIMGSYAVKLRDTDITEKREILENVLNAYWQQETNITVKEFDSIRQEYQEYKIERIVNPSKRFPIEQSYINLAMLETKEQQEKEKKLRYNEQSNTIMSTFEEIYGTKTTIDVKDMLEKCKGQTKKVLVLGRAGIGKSTFCRYVAYRWVKGEIWPQYKIVVLILLRRLTEIRYPIGKKYSLFDLVKEEYLPCNVISEYQERIFKKQCDNGEVLWLLDGYDEFVQNMPKQLEDLFEGLCKTQHHILTSRPYLITLSYDVQMEITGFTDNNIVEYVKQFFSQIGTQLDDGSTQRQKLLSFLKLNSSIWGIAHIPVNLELICSAWGDTDWSKTTTLTMTTLYDNITEWLCRRYLAKRNIGTQMKKKAIYNRCFNELSFLESLGFHGMIDNKIILSPKLLDKALQNTDCQLENQVDFLTLVLDIGILKSINYQPIGINIEADKDQYFVHLSFQEYFAARYLVNLFNGSTVEKAIEFIQRHKYNRRFSLMLSFASGIITENNNAACFNIFWDTILGDPIDQIGIRHMQIVFSCIEETGSSKRFSRCSELMKSVINYIQRVATCKDVTMWHYVRDSLRRSTVIVNEKELMEAFTDLLQTNDDIVKQWVIPMLEGIPALNQNAQFTHLLITALRDTNWYIRRRACGALGKMGETTATNDTIAALVIALGDVDSGVREVACEALGKMGEKAATNDVITSLMIALGDASKDVRRAACDAFGKMGEKAATNDVITSLVITLGDLDSRVGWMASDVLAKMGEKAPTNDVIAVLVIATRDASDNSRAWACCTLGQIGEKAATKDVIAALMTTLLDPNCNVKFQAGEALGRIGAKTATSDVIAGLVIALENANEFVRKVACKALGKMGEKAATNDVIRALMIALGDANGDVRHAACDTFGKMGEKAATNDVIAALVTALGDANWSVRLGACGALCKIGEKAATNDVIAALVTALQNPDFHISRMTSEVLAKIGEKGATNDVMILTLVTALKDAHKNVRYAAYRALGKMGEKAATNDVIRTLVAALEDANWHVRLEACEALGTIFEKAATNDVIRTLVTAHGDANWDVRLGACEALGTIGEKTAVNEVIPALLRALGDANERVICQARDTFCKMGEPAARESVITRFADIDKDHEEKRRFRCAAYQALGSMGEKAATNDVIRALAAALETFADEFAWSDVFEALGKMGEKAATNDVINGLLLHCKYRGWEQPFKVLIYVLVSCSSLSYLNSNTISKLFKLFNEGLTEFLPILPLDKFISAYFDTKINEWCSLIVLHSRESGSAITVSENTIVLYGDNEPVNWVIPSSTLRDKLVSVLEQAAVTGFVLA